MSKGKLIFSTHELHPDVTRALQGLGEYRVASLPTPDAILNESAGAEIIVVRARIAPEIIEREQGLVALVRHGAGLDMIPMETATQNGVIVANVPGVNATTVAEHAIWSTIALLRKYPQVNGDLRARGWEAGRKHADAGREISGRTLGIVGFGNIGRKVADIARHGFGMQVMAQTRTPATLPDFVEAASLDTLLGRADVVVLSCPLTEQTRGIISREAIATMKPGAILVNVSRGPVVDEVALIDALRAGHLGGAAVDVYAHQPLPPEHAFFGLENVILTPHMAGITEESMLRMGQGVVHETTRILAGERPGNFCNPEVWDAHLRKFR